MIRRESNHNPLNIRRDERTRWLGQRRKQHDHEYVQFQSDLFGFRAAFRILRSYIQVQGLCNLKEILHRWAPPEEGNNTRSYIETVSERSHVMPQAPLSFKDEATMVAIVCAMAWVENHLENLDVEMVKQAYLLVR